MKEKMTRLMNKTLSVLLAAALILSIPATGALAANNEAENDPVVVVSLGDSYSSGEGVPPFYGQDQNVYDKVHDYNWLAHRSENGWPGKLSIPGVSSELKNYNTELYNSSECKWYFRAASGAKTKDFSGEQEKPFKYPVSVNAAGQPVFLTGTENLPSQLSVFDGIGDSVDYVTFTLGGNDVDFKLIIETCVRKSTYLGSKRLETMISELWQNIQTTKDNLQSAYQKVHEKAPNAQIYIAGYPKLLEPSGKGAAISRAEAEMVNENVTKFNQTIKQLVESEDNNRHIFFFVDVEEAFDADGGHQAYCSDPWINPVWLVPREQDLNQAAIGSSYSMHPNEKGCAAYARCVSNAIQENMPKGTLSGKICQASDRSTPVSHANIDATLMNSNNSYGWVTYSNDTGNYSVDLMKGEYSVKISAPGFIPFTAYANVQPNTNNYMETYLLVQGQPGETGVASGKVTNAMTGSGVADVSLTVREGWNNTTHGDVVTTAATGSDGSYSLTLPIGNYTVYAEKGGYIAASFNIIVQPGTTGSQNGTISPIVSGDSFRAVLTWGENPSDLDSHVEGTLSDGGHFHVYYSHKSQYDGDVEVCNLDVDDTTSYGPETTTLNLTTDQPYYYYIYRYAGSGTVAASGAQIKLYQGENLVATFNVPTDQGSGDYWNVFAIVNGELVVRNTITGSADLSYIP